MSKTNISNNVHRRVVTVELENGDMWRRFHQHETEMTVTKPGRRMFPTLRYKVTGLEPSSIYSVHIRMVPVDEYRRRFQNGSWLLCGKFCDENVTTKAQFAHADTGAPLESSNAAATSHESPWLNPGPDCGADFGPIYEHPDSPASGQLWTSQTISFHKIKLTNNASAKDSGRIVLSSMRKYLPVLIVSRLTSDRSQTERTVVACQSFTETAFIAVTSYQNEAIIRLKINFNPFAKGFRVLSKASALQKISDTKLRQHGADDGVEADRDESPKRIKSAPTTPSDGTASLSTGRAVGVSPPVASGSPQTLSPMPNFYPHLTAQLHYATPPPPAPPLGHRQLINAQTSLGLNHHALLRMPVPLPVLLSGQPLQQPLPIGAGWPTGYPSAPFCHQQNFAASSAQSAPTSQQQAAFLFGSYTHFLQQLYDKM